MLRPDDDLIRSVELAEWQRVGPNQDSRLVDLSLAGSASARRRVESLRKRLGVTELRQGLEISSTSFVGRVDVGPVRISIIPKLPAMPLSTLLRYAYGLRDLALIAQTRAPTVRYGLHDVLIAMLVAEVDELIHRGLHRQYIPLTQRLQSPRGRILIDELSGSGGLAEARLPCRHFDRQVDWHLNRVLRAGLDSAAPMTDDRDLRRSVHRVAEAFGDVRSMRDLTIRDIDRADNEITRVTAAAAPALTIVRLLHQMLGTGVERGDLSPMSGFLFDMNLFFQNLLSRFLRENLITRTIVDEWVIKNIFSFAAEANPKRRSAPAPRPDFALFCGKVLTGFVDAKYRDLWEQRLPAEWLYQLSIYALASPSRTSVLLYATMSDDARDERIEVRQPIQWSNDEPASIILRPVPLMQLAELVHQDKAANLRSDRRRWAEELVLPEVRKTSAAVESGIRAA